MFARRCLAVVVCALFCASSSAFATIVTKSFTGTLTCFAGCAPASAATTFLQNVPFTGSYSYDDSVTPTSGDPSTFRNYAAHVAITIDIGGGVYTVSASEWSLEIQRKHSNPNITLQDEVFFLYGSAPTVGGTGVATFAPFIQMSPPSLIHFVDFTSTVVLPDTLIANWPQTVAAWSTGFAGIEFFIQDASSNLVEYRGAFATLVDGVAAPTIATTASPGVTLGAGSLQDSATVSGRLNPQAGATIDFDLFGPGDPTCAGPPVFQSHGVSYPVAGGAVASASFVPALAGTYHWIAAYSGDANNPPASGACSDAGESVVVARAATTIASTASSVGGAIGDSATVSGRINPQAGATVDFRLYGPGDGACAGPPVFQSLAVPYPVAGGPVASGTFAPPQPGTYRWIASYSGDANNLPAAGACGAAGESVLVGVTEVPTLGPWALGALVAALSVAGLLAARRRRART